MTTYLDPYPWIIENNEMFDYNVKPPDLIDYDKFKYYNTENCINLEECPTIRDAINWVKHNDFWGAFPNQFYYDIVKDIYITDSGKVKSNISEKKLNERYKKQTEECLRKVNEDFDKMIKRFRKMEMEKRKIEEKKLKKIAKQQFY